MKFSLNTLLAINQRYGCADDISALGLDALVDKINAQLGALDDVKSFGDKYQGIVIAKLVDCQPHPNADKLRVCTIDDGGNTPDVKRDEQGHVQVVCGAPNARAGLTVAWLPPGSTVPETYDKEPFVLEARDFRGVVSNGMLASLKELGLGDNHDGILEIDGERQPGADFAQEFGLAGDVIFDIENKMFTHRPDLFGFLGISRELAGIQGIAFKSPAWYAPKSEFPAVEADELPLSVKNDLPDLVPRFTAVVMRDVKVGPSPVWLQVELAKLGQKSINNIVDYTNWFMLETGQPLHAFDYDKVKALSAGDAAMVVRHPNPGEKIKLLNGKEIEPRAEAIMIATDKELISVGGVMGGVATEVDADTTNIILECANFDMYSIRRTSMEHGLFTDAVTRFTKGQSPLQNLTVLAKTVIEIREHANGKVASEVIDVSNSLSEQNTVPITSDFVNQRLGLNLTPLEIKRLLENVEVGVSDDAGKLSIHPPFWRTDIGIAEDIVEEVGRLYGYDKLPLELPPRDVTPTDRDPMLDLKARLRGYLSRAGANEVLTYSFVNGDLLNKVGQDSGQAFEIANALSPDLQYYRLSLTPSLLDKIHANLKSGYDKFALFELGRAHFIGAEDEGVPIGFERLACVVSASPKQAGKSAAYYDARLYLMQVLAGFNLSERAVFEPLELGDTVDHMTLYYQPGRSAAVKIDDVVIGYIGEYKSSVRKSLKLPDYTAGFELHLTLLDLKVGKHYVALPKFPKVTQDITLKVPVELSYQELFSFVRSRVDDLQPDKSLSILSPIDIFQKSDEPSAKRVTLRLVISNYQRTLTDVEINKLLDKVAAEADVQLKAQRV